MFYKTRLWLAEKLHPEISNVDYWVLRSLGKKDYNLDISELKKTNGTKKVKKMAEELLANTLFTYLLTVIEKSEVNHLVKNVTTIQDFSYSRCVIHVIDTIKNKLQQIKSSEITDETEFDKFDII